jgi:hypothetical protein
MLPGLAGRPASGMHSGDGQAAAHFIDGMQELASVGRTQVRIPAGGQRHQRVKRRGQARRDTGRRRDDLVDMLVGDR